MVGKLRNFCTLKPINCIKDRLLNRLIKKSARLRNENQDRKKSDDRKTNISTTELTA